jgi:NTP pyrophosphatase (non-canonical NTP hydrolase)
MNIKQYQKNLRDFINERDWDQFHTPKNLVMALAGEAGELLDIFQWLTPKESLEENLDKATKQAAREEIADVFIYLLRLSDKLNINLEEAVNEKMEINTKNYPKDLSKGTALKKGKLGNRV